MQSIGPSREALLDLLQRGADGRDQSDCLLYTPDAAGAEERDGPHDAAPYATHNHITVTR